MKRLLVLFVVLFTVFFSYTIIAQEMGALKKGFEINLPEKVQTPLGPPLAAEHTRLVQADISQQLIQHLKS